MKQRRVLALVVIAVAAVVLTGGLLASNMGFKLNKTLQAQQAGVSAAGFQLIGLPYNQQVGVNTAKDLLDDITSGGVSAASLQKYNILSGGYDPYPGVPDFLLNPGEGYFLGVTTTGPYIIVGSHNPSHTVQFKAQAAGVSAAGFQLYAHPYHGVAGTAKQLLDEIAPAGASVQKYNILSGGYDPYPGVPDFPLVPGEGYFVGVTANKNFIPAHY